MDTSAKTGMKAQESFADAAKLLFQDYCKYKVENLKKGEQLSPESTEEPP